MAALRHQIYVNGREWLSRQLDDAGIGYLRYDNALLRIADLEAAPELCERFAHRVWGVRSRLLRCDKPVLVDESSEDVVTLKLLERHMV